MRVTWIGMNDENGCVLNWHELRVCLQEQHGVTLKGPGYSYSDNRRAPLSHLVEGDEDWIVIDDCNAMGYPALDLDVRPDCKVAWREHDWHNKSRIAVADFLKPDLILGCVDRPEWDKYRSHPGWRLCPHPINTQRFHPGNGQMRPYPVGLYGKVGRCYEKRSAARRHLSECGDAWLPVHGGYWRDGRGSLSGRTFYNDELAEALRHVACLWVDGSDWKVFLQKYTEGAASGCLLLGEVPYAWERYYPKDSMIPCEPGEALEFVEWFRDHEGQRAEYARLATEHAQKAHSVETRAKEIMEVLDAA